MGQLAVRAASDRDPALMMGVVLIIGTAVLVSNILVDVTYAPCDPGPPWQRRADAAGDPGLVAAEHFSPETGRPLRRFVRHRLAVIGIVILVR